MKDKGGRPTVMTESVLNKLEYVFALGGSDLEACGYADISRQTLYDYQKKHPEFIDRKQVLKEKMILKARHAVDRGLSQEEGDKAGNLGLKFLERRKPKEFSVKQEVEHTGGITISQQVADEVLQAAKEAGHDEEGT